MLYWPTLSPWSVSRRLLGKPGQILKGVGAVEDGEPAHCLIGESLERRNALPLKETPRVAVSEATNHPTFPNDIRKSLHLRVPVRPKDEAPEIGRSRPFVATLLAMSVAVTTGTKAQPWRQACRQPCRNTPLREKETHCPATSPGTPAADRAPVTFFFTREVETNHGYVWYRKDGAGEFAIGVRQGDGEAALEGQGLDPYGAVPRTADTTAVMGRFFENFALYNAPRSSRSPATRPS